MKHAPVSPIQLGVGGQRFVWRSDVLEVALDTREKFDAFPDELLHVDKIDPDMLCDDEGWLFSNPMGIRTERERSMHNSKVERHTGGCIRSGYNIPCRIRRCKDIEEAVSEATIALRPFLPLSLLLWKDIYSCSLAPILLYNVSRTISEPQEL
ncbi:hypothetical protein Vadar_017831 [Vaccinium darrowii]|uniref:Uncharacterized protein n=1 Tax=Vaccinium darrowii TaxID=229202 RepID=A0ACB7Y819_9ERIC|nr:hypothetical protein Vadar_017831 [Vaccinium darrowii]